MGKNKKKLAYSPREEEKAKKVLRNLIVGLVVVALAIVLVSSLL